jgi:ABC-type multidrug transport system fused ATPase/permease subunit
MSLKTGTRRASTGGAQIGRKYGANGTRNSHSRLFILAKLIAYQTAARVFGDGETTMFSFRDLFQWERFVTPSIIKLFFWLAVAIIILIGLSGIASALQMMTTSAGVGFFMLLGSLLGVTVGILFARIVAEFVLIVFRINEHLGAIRNRGEL